MRSAVLEAFEARFGGLPEVVASAPGRVNLIGEHTDYSEGWVMPAAIDRRTWIAARRVPGASRIHSLERGDARSFEASDVRPGIADWGAYVAGAAWALGREGFDSVPNIEAVVGSDVPIGAGLSSSAALLVAAVAVWDRLGQMALAGSEIARIAHRAESGYVGLSCGMMDQTASSLGRVGCALLLDTRTLDVRYVPIPEAWALVVCDTCTPRTLANSAYNERRREVEHAASILGVPSLRDASIDLVECHAAALGPVLVRRARHVVTENGRVHAAAAALDRGDAPSVGLAMRDSHASLRDCFEVSSAALDAMAQAAWEAPGCIGARMTGAGFGGACVALVHRRSVPEFLESVNRRYLEGQGNPASLLLLRPDDGVPVEPDIR